MRDRVNRFNHWFDVKLQIVSDKSLELLIDLNGYHVAACFLLLLLIGSATEPNNGVLLAIAARYPLFTPLFWNCTFALCTFMMIRNHEGQFEDIVAYLFFIIPVSIFFYFLIDLTVYGRAQATPYFIVMLILACVFIIDMFVARTRVINHLKLLVVGQRQTIEQLNVTVSALEIKVKNYEGGSVHANPA